MQDTSLPLRLRCLGRRDYASVFAAMREFTDARRAETGDELWLVEHEPVFTQGLAGRSEHLLAPGDIPVVQTDRGGQVTYHGPGQLVLYPLLDLERRKLGVRCLVDRLEQSVIDVLMGLGVSAGRRDGMPGVYVDLAKIASIGLKVRRGCSYHGLALNLDLDLAPFALINPCGYAGLAMTRLLDHVPQIDPETVARLLVTAFCRNLQYAACDDIELNSPDRVSALDPDGRKTSV
ncbi:MAG: lipoyl(octanoyl) transferase LipB [Wenzhouxiangella sp.]